MMSEPRDDHDCIDWNSGGACYICQKPIPVDVQLQSVSDPDSSVPLSAIRALVQQWEELARTADDRHFSRLSPGDIVRGCARELAALCPAPPEDQK